ncbi:MAG: sulfatase-like hydrolase/transferase [Planctomycetaceae bacterium]
MVRSSERPPGRPSVAVEWCLGAVVLSTACAPLSAQPERKPNVLVIVSDNQGWGDIGYNDSEIKTPILDSLARGGVRFDQFYVYPMCSPTRAAFVSGRAPSRYDINGAIGRRSRQALPPDTVTVADVLKAQGYETAIMGKWHLGLRPEVGPLQYGFDTSYGFFHGQIDKLTHHYKNGDPSWHRNDQWIQESGHSLDLITDEAIRFMARPRQRPFFLYVPYGAPHPPLQETEKWVAPYRPLIRSPSRRLYAAATTHMDAAIGRLIAALERTGQRQSTMVVFFSDNGAIQKWPAQPRNYEGRFGPYPVLGDNGPLRGWIGELYDGCVRTPALVNWPSRLQPGVVREVTSVLDLFPTLVALAQGRTQSEWHLEGLNLWPRLFDQQPVPERVLYWKSYNGKRAAVRRDDWKLIVDRQTGATELFHMKNDPYERMNLAELEANRVAQLRRVLAEQALLDSRPPP